MASNTTKSTITLSNIRGYWIKPSPTKKYYKCDICENRFMQKGNLKRHTRLIHEKVKKNQSDKNYGDGDLIKHMQSHSSKTYNCEICYKVLKQRSSFTRHMKTHKKSEGYKCEICEKEFSRPDYLKKHVKISHEKECKYPIKHDKQICNICNKKITQLKNHFKTIHEGQKKFKCDVCKKLFSSKNNLEIHVKRVHEEKIYLRCCQFCNARYSSYQSLETHIEFVHKDTKIITCDYCNKSFKKMCIFKRHVTIVHEGIRNIICPKCNKGFKEPVTLKRHFMNI